MIVEQKTINIVFLEKSLTYKAEQDEYHQQYEHPQNKVTRLVHHSFDSGNDTDRSSRDPSNDPLKRNEPSPQSSTTTTEIRACSLRIDSLRKPYCIPSNASLPMPNPQTPKEQNPTLQPLHKSIRTTGLSAKCATRENPLLPLWHKDRERIIFSGYLLQCLNITNLYRRNSRT